jgi:DNA-directed RNA polymerase specialized sigma24 family protein
VVATLTRQFGDLDVAEEAAAEAFATAVERWPADGVPPNPGGWLTTTARRKALDRIRRDNKRDDKHKQALMMYDDSPSSLGAVDDERLRLMFTCCHPALAPEARVALTLRMVGGLTVPEIARAFLVAESAVGSDHPREGQDQGGVHPRSSGLRRGSPGTRIWRARRAVPRLQRGLPGYRPRHRSGASRPEPSGA